jgi:excisionase family DNA binding protein
MTHSQSHTVTMDADSRKLEPLLTVHELARRLGWHPNTVYNKVHRNEIPFVKIGRSLRFRPSEIEHWIIQETAKAEESAA